MRVENGQSTDTDVRGHSMHALPTHSPIVIGCRAQFGDIPVYVTFTRWISEVMTRNTKNNFDKYMYLIEQ